MNKCHRYLNLPFEIKPLSHFDEERDIIQHNYLYNAFEFPELYNWMNNLGVELYMGETFYTPPYSKIPIHTDHSGYTNHVKINVTWGPQEGVTQWWKSDSIKSESTYKHGGMEIGENSLIPHLWAEEEDCELLYEANTNRPSLVNVGILHGTNNPTSEGRWTLSFIPRKGERYVHWDDAIDIFKDYLDK